MARGQIATRVDQASLDHPWLWALVPALAGLLIGVRMLDSAAAGVALALVGFLTTGWSMSRGPGRRLTQHRLDRRSADPAQGRGAP